MQCLNRKMSDYQFEDSPNPFGKMPGQRFKDTSSEVKEDNYGSKFRRKENFEAYQKSIEKEKAVHPSYSKKFDPNQKE